MGLPIEANMSAAERLKFSGPPPSGPGIFASLSKITDSSLTDETFNKWYNEVHVRDVLKTGCITKAYRFKHKNPNAERPYLAIYICPDMSVIGGERMKSIPMTSDVLGGRNCHDLANFDTRFYTTTQEILKENISQKDLFSTIMLAGMQPKEGTADDMDAWYREEHIDQMYELEPGLKRATRYSLIFSVLPGEQAPSFLTVYEFDESNKLGQDVQALDPMTDWTKKVIGNSSKIEAGIYVKIGEYS